jgi:hypothetical protein
MQIPTHVREVTRANPSGGVHTIVARDGTLVTAEKRSRIFRYPDVIRRYSVHRVLWEPQLRKLGFCLKVCFRYFADG